MTREEFESILEEAFMAGYEDAMNEVFDEESTFDLESEMNAYTESSKNVRKQMDKLRELDKRGYNAFYRNGTAPSSSYDSKTPHPNAINKGLDWVGNTSQSGNNEYTVKNNGRRYTTRGRIKTDDNSDEVFKNGSLRYHLKKNAELVAGRKAREIAEKNLNRSNKPGIFKNKGNKY